ncbi:hypothetical protein LTR56_010348 [Elasticomyces elasticus]|nr:hypothetical protein LTR56_010348 [Elasticomyces elasticus]KAK3656916.1 hypothetical protein LTR22_009578 [Elasticomyces elasticus]KAK4926081.1 hypothetical protein LTR49_006996 [Elasticomyces elasticus]KAK5766148.1 hypothetical protein LTS12_003631 [Elasticomyces elasticus]
MSLQLRAGLAWATPIHPVTLLNHLDAYMKALPDLHSLRLCWKFGKGEDVHITRLPVEIEQAIEHLLLQSRRTSQVANCFYITGWYNRELEFACFESTCEPSAHCDDMSPIMYSLEHEEPERCEVCKETDSNGCHEIFFHADRCLKRCSTAIGACSACQVSLAAVGCECTCHAIYEDLIERFKPEEGYWTHQYNQENWCKRIELAQDTSRTESDKLKRGDLKVGHSQILRKYFGLDIHLAHTTLDSRSDSWPKYRNDKYHKDELRKTTLCYLTLPKRLGATSSHEKKDETDPTSVQAARAMKVDPASLVIIEEKQRRFGRAMKILRLKVFLHGSQNLGSTISADVSAPRSVGAGGQGSGQGDECLQWPQLLLLVEGS